MSQNKQDYAQRVVATAYDKFVAVSKTDMKYLLNNDVVMEKILVKHGIELDDVGDSPPGEEVRD